MENELLATVEENRGQHTQTLKKAIQRDSFSIRYQIPF